MPSLSLPSRRHGALVFAAALLAPQAHGTEAAPAADAGTPVVVIVRVPKPWYAPRALIAGKMRDTMPQYAQLPGLLFKAYSFERDSGDFGGVYHWASAAQAQAWFNPAWFDRVRQERGVAAQVRRFEAPVSIDNTPGGTPADSHSSAVATLVQVPTPAGVGREQLIQGFRAALPTYRQVPGLLRKHFTLSEDGRFGGVYLWRDEASARAWFNADWHARVKQTYGAPAAIEWFDTPVLLPTGAAVNAAQAAP